MLYYHFLSCQAKIFGNCWHFQAVCLYYHVKSILIEFKLGGNLSRSLPEVFFFFLITAFREKK